ncbi:MULTISPECIES: diguanylate cyclase domain-containing protein [unclassified Cyanobium]|uniref:GGDEF domain-containing protein n=1 Tax=unclassified Cyanobium TaxID=2627006 RepID=UPI0020CE3644|nr:MULTISPECIES: diguanylate cyclase [unclassified Cyanobium]MCP9833015.1 diguanylate cyclase [Cyanobium sp. La Preciosa 7G6]MCP9935765.1 diguanylate cyclase [Cyanobium sp. Aljojuca 7A6]
MRLPHGSLTPRQGLLLALLAGLTVLGNVSVVPLFFSIQFLLGSIAATFTLLWRRGWWNVAFTIVASLYTWKIWGHPWAIVIFGAEALWLAVFVNRFSGPPQNDLKGRLILADIAFWLLVGTPLVFFLYGHVLHIDPANVAVVAAKQVVNGIANTVVAFLLFVLLQVRRNWQGQGLLPLRGLVFSLVLAAITLPSLGVTLRSGNLLQSATQQGVLENLRSVGEAAARIDPLQLGEPSRGLPASSGATAFLLIDNEGTRISSNPGLFLRLEDNFSPASPEHILVSGLQILVPRGNSPALKVWVNGYWSTTLTSARYLVQVVQPAAPMVLSLQEQSTSLLLTVMWMMLVGVLLSEVVATVVEGQMQTLRLSLLETPRSPALNGSLASEAPAASSRIVEVQDLASRLQEQHRKVAQMSQDFTDVSARLKQCSERQRLLSSTDPLTGINTRSNLEHVLKRVAQRSRSCSVPLSCLAFSVHGLRPINTLHGMQKGDEILRHLIASVQQFLHANDELFRLGGSAFLVLLWDQRLESARTTAEQIRKVVSETDLPPCDGSLPQLTMNAGMSLLAASDTTGQEMFSRVELALNQSRDLGTNQVVVR